jgi:hypothetical protein
MDKTIDSFDQDLLYIWMKLYHQNEYDLFINKLGKNYFILPLHFFFCDQSNLSFNITRSAFVELSIDIKINDLSNLVTNGDLIDPTKHKITVGLLSNSIFLDMPEIRSTVRPGPSTELKFLQHYQTDYFHFENNYLVANIKNFCHPVPQILFTIQPNNNIPFDYKDALEEGFIDFGGMIKIPITPLSSTIDKYISNINQPDIPIYSVTFGPLIPELINSVTVSTINLSRIDSIKINLRFKEGFNSGIVKIWFPNYNIFKYNDGLCGTLFN